MTLRQNVGIPERKDSKKAETLLRLWDRVKRAGSEGIDADDLADHVTRAGVSGTGNATRKLEDLGNDLEKLPGISRKRISIEADDVYLEDLETIADLDAARETIAEPPVERWHYSSEGDV